MSEPEPPPPAETPAPPAPPIVPPFPPRPAPQNLAARWGPAWLEPTLLYLLPLLGSAFCLLLCANNASAGVLRPMLGSAVTLLSFMIAFHKLNPPLVGLLLIGVILTTYYVLPMYAVLWMAASAMGGLAAALLLRRAWFEADLLAWPPLVVLAAFIALIWLGSAMRLTEAHTAGERWVAREVTEVRDQAAELRKAMPQLITDEVWTEMQGYFGWALGSELLFFWVLGLWVTTRIARRILGAPARHPRSSLIFFQLQQRQIFLLIGGLVLAILDSLAGLPGLMICALPLLVIVVLGGLLAGVAVLLFRVALWKAQKRILSARLMLLGFVLGLVFIGPTLLALLGLLGLLDAWLDFRKLRMLRVPLGLA